MSSQCLEAHRLLATYRAAQATFDKADKALVTNSTVSDPAYIAAWLTRRKAEKALMTAMKAYRLHLERHQCQSGLFTDVA